MKKIYKSGFILVLAIVALFSSCEKKEQSAQGFVEFGYASSTLKIAIVDSIKPLPMPVPGPEPVPPVTNDIYALLVTISDASGNVMISKQEMPLYNLNGDYISKQLSLKPGKYRLVDFLVINSTRKVIYATPKSGSVKASMVSKPLPFEFEIAANSTSHIVPEVVTIDNTVTAGDLGYATFGFEIVDPADMMCLNLIVIDGLAKCNCLVSVPSRVQIYANGSTLVLDQKLEIEGHMIKFKKCDQYTFVVTSGTFAPFKQMFTSQQLLSYSCQMNQRLTIKMGSSMGGDTTKILPVPYTVSFDQQFKLMQGMSAQMQKDVLRVEFVSYKDSRCPPNAVCIWAGEFSVMLKIYMSGITKEIEVKGKSTASYGPYTFELIDLLPPPGEVSIPEKTAILVVHNSGAIPY